MLTPPNFFKIIILFRRGDLLLGSLNYITYIPYISHDISLAHRSKKWISPWVSDRQVIAEFAVNALQRLKTKLVRPHQKLLVSRIQDLDLE